MGEAYAVGMVALVCIIILIGIYLATNYLHSYFQKKYFTCQHKILEQKLQQTPPSTAFTITPTAEDSESDYSVEDPTDFSELAGFPTSK